MKMIINDKDDTDVNTAEMKASAELARTRAVRSTACIMVLVACLAIEEGDTSKICAICRETLKPRIGIKIRAASLDRHMPLQDTNGCTFLRTRMDASVR